MGWIVDRALRRHIRLLVIIQISFSTRSILKIRGHWNPFPTCRNKWEHIRVTESTDWGGEEEQVKWESLKLSICRHSMNGLASLLINEKTEWPFELSCSCFLSQCHNWTPHLYLVFLEWLKFLFVYIDGNSKRSK